MKEKRAPAFADAPYHLNFKVVWCVLMLVENLGQVYTALDAIFG